jgi:hypothetical protein
MISLTIRYARTNARVTSEDEVSFQTVIVFHACSLLASVLLYSCKGAVGRCDIDGKMPHSGVHLLNGHYRHPQGFLCEGVGTKFRIVMGY